MPDLTAGFLRGPERAAWREIAETGDVPLVRARLLDLENGG